MKKFNKLLCLLLLAVLIPVTNPNVHSADLSQTADGSQYGAELEFISALGITESVDTKDYYRTVTRAEFVSMAVGMLNISHASVNDGTFIDVPADSVFSSDIYTAYNYGLLKGTSETLFSPDMPITYASAIKILVALLGYEEYAYLNGGYPGGYIIQAKKLELLDGVAEHTMDASLVFGTVVTLISNSLTCNLRNVVAVGDDYIRTSVSGEENCLSVYFNLTRVSGVVVTAGYSSMQEGYNEEKSYVQIGDTLLNGSLTYADKYLGYNVDAWYNSDTNELVTLHALPGNNTVVIEGKNVESYDDFKLKYRTNDYNSIKTYSLDKGYTFVLNGRVIAANESDFMFENGTITLLDNNGDRKYDVVLSNEKTYVVVRGINSSTKTVYDKKRDDITLVLKNEDGYHYTMIKDGQSVDHTVLKSDMVLEVAQSADGYLSDIVVCTESVRGTITGIGEDTVYINNIAYESNDYFKKYFTPQLEQSGIFLLAPDGRLTSVSGMYVEAVQYGFFLDMASKSSLDNDMVMIKLFTDAGDVRIFNLAEKVKLDGELVYSTDSAIKNLLMANNIPNYQLIRFGTDSVGNIKLIDTSANLEHTDDLVQKYAESQSADNSLTKYIDATKTQAYWRKAGNAFAPFFTIGDTIMMQVPSALLSGQPTERYVDDAFSIISTANLPNYAWTDVDAYDYDNSMTPKIIVLYRGTATPGAVSLTIPSESDPIHLVEKVVDCINEDGEETKRIYSYSQGAFHISDIDSGVLDELILADRIPQPGDVVRLSFSGKYINGIARDALFNRSVSAVNVQYGVDGVDDRPIATHTYVSGNVFSCVNDSSLVIKTDNYPGNSQYPTPVDGLCSLRVASDTVVVIYNTDTGLVEHGEISDISDIRSVGEDSSSYVCVGLGAYDPEFIVIYR